MTDLSRAIAVKPVITYPREAQVGKTYLMTINLQPEEGFEWQYEEEEYPIYCTVDSELFSSKPVGEPVVVLHRFGGSYGEVKFLLTASPTAEKGNVRVSLINQWGVPIKCLQLTGIEVQQQIVIPLSKIGEASSSTFSSFDLRRYQEGIRERYGNLKLDSLHTRGYAYNELKLWRMFIPQNVREVHQFLPQIHEVPKEHQRRLRESNQLEAEIPPEEWERYKQVYWQQPTRSILDIVSENQDYKYLVILGDQGSGKSTLLQYIALQWAELPTKDLPLKPIPLLIELRTYMRNRDSNQCQDFLEFFHKGSGIICHLNQHQLHEWLKEGNAIVMFDGLDEVFDPSKREEVTIDIHRFTNEYPNVRVIVTSRVIGYKSLRAAWFRHFMLQDLEPEQIREFINRWHDLTFKDEVDKVRKRDHLQLAIDNSSAIRELAENPLLLTMMAILNRHQELPRDRPELYNQVSRVLLHQWDVERALVEDQRLETIDYKDKQAMLRRVAYHVVQANEKGLAGNLINAADLEKILTDYLKTIEVSNARAVARLMINQLRTRNFILCFVGADYYAFMHRTFLEYFCAWEFVWQFRETQILSIEQLKHEVYGKHWQDESWHEVLRLIAGMIEPKFTGEIINYLLEQVGKNKNFINLFLAVGCLSEVSNFSTVIAKAAANLKTSLKRLAQNNPDSFTSNSILQIANMGEYEPELLKIFEILLKKIAFQDNGKLTALIQALVQISKVNQAALSILKSFTQSLYHKRKHENNPFTPGRFSIISTKIKITDTEIMKSSLRDLGITVKTDANVRGHDGQRVRADLVAVLEGEYDLGWSLKSDGNYDLIADLGGITKGYKEGDVINLIHIMFAVKKALGDI